MPLLISFNSVRKLHFRRLLGETNGCGQTAARKDQESLLAVTFFPDFRNRSTFASSRDSFKQIVRWSAPPGSERIHRSQSVSLNFIGLIISACAI